MASTMPRVLSLSDGDRLIILTSKVMEVMIAMLRIHDTSWTHLLVIGIHKERGQKLDLNLGSTPRPTTVVGHVLLSGSGS